MATLEGESGRNKVPIDRVAAAAYRIVFGRLGRVLELAWLPVLVLLAVELVPGLVSDYFLPDDTAAASSLAADIAGDAIATICLSAFAVRWLHLVLAADRPLSVKRLVVVWARFLGYSLPFCLAIIGAAAGISAVLDAVSSLLADRALGEPLTQNVANAVVAIVALAVFLVLARCSLVFPAVVVGQPLGPIRAWRRMRGNTWRFIAATLLVTAPMVLLVAVIFELILDGAHLTARDALEHPPLGLFLLDGVLDVMLSFLLVALGATVLADFYRRLVLHVRSN
jgi:hypothetical protein